MKKTQKILKLILLIGTILATIKVIFVDYSMDEEYQLLMSYRQLSGDSLFGTMWEPHQTSAFLCTFLLRLYYLITGTYTGIVLFLHFFTVLIQFALCFWLYHVLCRFMEKDYSFLISLASFQLVPKLIQIPEFSNLQLWFLMILTLSLLEYQTNEKYALHSVWILLAGIAMSLEVLSYPSSLLLFPYVLIHLYISSKKSWKSPILLSLTCAGCALVYLAVIFYRISPSDFIRNLKYIVTLDLTHDLTLSAGTRLLLLLKQLFEEVSLVLLCSLFSLFCLLPYCKKTGEKLKDQRILFVALTVLFSEFLQLFFWLVLQFCYEKPQLHLFTCLMAGIVLWKDAGSKQHYLSFGILASVITLMAVVYASDLSFYYSIPHALLGSVFCLVTLVFALSNRYPLTGRPLILFLLCSFVIVSMVGKGFTIRGGRGNNITSIRNVMRSGPAIGIFSTYMCCHINDINNKDFQKYIKPGEKVLIVTNQVHGPGTTPYMVIDAEICHFSIVDPTSYDERLLTYWDLYPEKEPNVIVVDCWYGSLLEQPDSWIMQYIENDFHYSEVIDGEYVRFYKK